MSETPNEMQAGPRYTEAQRRTLAAVLDEIVPPSDDGRMPGAGALGLAEAVDAALGSTPELRAPVADGLARLEALAQARGAAAFAALDAADRLVVLSELIAEAPFFLGGLVYHTYRAYYAHPRVLIALDLAPRPPFPEGYEVAPSDLSGLEAVRARGPRYRTC